MNLELEHFNSDKSEREVQQVNNTKKSIIRLLDTF